MKWAFWRRRKPRATDAGRADRGSRGEPGAGTEDAGGDAAAVRMGQAAGLRVRMRRRLIGAAALLLGTAVVVPMMLDPSPRPLPDNIAIDIPSERTPFAPRLSLPASAPISAPGAPAGGAADAPGATAGKPADSRAPEAVDEPPAPAPGVPGASTGSPAEARSAEMGRFYVQAGALSSESAARQLSEHLSKAGMKPFVERTDTSGSVLYRVRLGPFASREAAVKARKRLHSMSVDSNVVRAEQAGR
jgi:DedD protein